MISLLWVIEKFYFQNLFSLCLRILVVIFIFFIFLPSSVKLKTPIFEFSLISSDCEAECKCVEISLNNKCIPQIITYVDFSLTF